MGQARPSSSPTTLAKFGRIGSRQSRGGDVGRLARGHRRERQRGPLRNVAKTMGSIGYVEFAYAKQNKLTYASMAKKAGNIVAPTMDAFQAAAAKLIGSTPWAFTTSSPISRHCLRSFWPPCCGTAWGTVARRFHQEHRAARSCRRLAQLDCWQRDHYAAIGAPIGILAGTYLAEYGAKLQARLGRALHQ